jgi:prevent-host-death family protein
MINDLPIRSTLDALIPITRFNKGEANKIFDEVAAAGYKIVVKNNAPACVLISPEKYKEMAEMIEDRYLLALAEERERHDKGGGYAFKYLLHRDGCALNEIDGSEDVEIE